MVQVLSEKEVWFSSPGHRHVSAKLAAVCSTGVMPCGQMTHATSITWQLIRGAAVADPKVTIGQLLDHCTLLVCRRQSAIIGKHWSTSTGPCIAVVSSNETALVDKYWTMYTTDRE